MNKLADCSATELVKNLKEKQIGSLELLEFYFERYTRLNPGINAIVATDFENARKKAKAADNSIARGKVIGPLHGLPMTIKDNIEVTGMPTTYGVPLFKDFIPSHNADVAQALKDAGAVIFGKTNLPLMGMDTQSFNDIYGQTNNPWDAALTPGGSSGGAAAALAGGLTSLEIGNDIGGSIRIPAHFCGVYGHKSSYGIVSMRCRSKPFKRILPDYVDTDLYPPVDLAVNGPLARSAQDLKLAMDVIVGPPRFERKAISIKLPPSRKKRLKAFRVGVWMDHPLYPPDTEVGNCLEKFTENLSKAGVDFKTKKPDVDLKRCHDLRNILELMSLSHRQPQDKFDSAVQMLKTLTGENQGPETVIARALTGYVRDWNILNTERAVIRDKWEAYFKEIDVLLCPVVRIAAHPHDHTDIIKRTVRFNERDQVYWDVVGPWNSLSLVAYLPSTVAPVGQTANGLPVGVQIIGPYLEDSTTIEFANLMEREGISCFKAPPGFE
jgi:amidase